MSQLSELVAMESEIRKLRESIQRFYLAVEFENYEIKDFVNAMVENISQPECLEALVRLEQIAADNYTSLSNIDTWMCLPQTEPTIICARYVNSSDTVCYYELVIDVDLEDRVDGIYSTYSERV